jgi:hypothetical protein
VNRARSRRLDLASKLIFVRDIRLLMVRALADVSVGSVLLGAREVLSRTHVARNVIRPWIRLIATMNLCWFCACGASGEVSATPATHAKTNCSATARGRSVSVPCCGFEVRSILGCARRNESRLASTMLR